MTQLQDAPVADDVATDAAAEPDNNRRTLVLLGVVAALLLAAGGWFLLGGGGSGDEQPFVLPPTVHHPAKTTTEGTAAKPAQLPPVSTAKLGRDPFHAQYVVPVAPAAPADGSTGGGTGSATGGGTSSGGKPVASTYALKLTRVDGTGSDLTARFLVGDSKKLQYARAGSVFGQTQEIRLLSIQKGPNGSGTAVIQVGDDTPFDLSTSDATIYVQ